MKILFLEPFFGGSHKDVARGFADGSSHEVEVLTLPPRFWKWRMRGAALWFVRQIEKISAYDVIFATDMMDLADFKALAGRECPPVALYFHENQLSYPLGPHEKRDFHLGFTNMVSALAADLVLFNSEFHRGDFFKAAKNLIKQMPDTRPSWMMDRIEQKSRILYPGCKIPPRPAPVQKGDNELPLVIWNHRWEYDKNPNSFFRVMEKVKKKGINFRLAVMGEQYEIIPDVFKTAETRFEQEIVVFGFQSSAKDYRSWLSKGTCVVSTAIQENFGISIIEAIAHGCFPLLPNRLSYPELIPESFHKEVIYKSEKELAQKLALVLKGPDEFLSARQSLSAHASGFSWDHMIGVYDQVLEDLAGKESGTDLI